MPKKVSRWILSALGEPISNSKPWLPASFTSPTSTRTTSSSGMKEQRQSKSRGGIEQCCAVSAYRREEHQKTRRSQRSQIRGCKPDGRSDLDFARLHEK